MNYVDVEFSAVAWVVVGFLVAGVVGLIINIANTYFDALWEEEE